MKHQIQTQHGFTLIELLIAMLLGGIVAVTLGTITKAMSNEAKTQQMIIEASQHARTGIDRIRLDMMRVGMFAAANPRAEENPDSMVSKTAGQGTQDAYYRNPIVHLNPPSVAAAFDSVVLVGNFVGSMTYEGIIDTGQADVMTVTNIPQGLCEVEFNGSYAFAHIITATGQTHEANIASATQVNCSAGMCECNITTDSGELIAGAFGERHVKVSANQAILYRVETVDQRNVLVRYFVDYVADTAQSANCVTPSNVSNWIVAGTEEVIAENVVDFQVWFRPIDPSSTGGNIDLPLYHYPLPSTGLLPPETNVIVGETEAANATTAVHLSCPVSGGSSNEISPEHVRSAIVSLATRTEMTDQSIEVDTASVVVDRKLEDAPVGDIGKYKTSRYTVEVPLPNITSQMNLFQYTGTPSF